MSADQLADAAGCIYHLAELAVVQSQTGLALRLVAAGDQVAATKQRQVPPRGVDRRNSVLEACAASRSAINPDLQASRGEVDVVTVLMEASAMRSAAAEGS
jgi:hypothetical protein